MVFFDLAAGFFRRNARSEGAAEGGCGGNSAAPERSSGAKRRRSIRVLRKMGSDFFKQTPPNLICRRSYLGASPLGIGFRQEIPGGFEFRRALAFGNFKTATFFENQAVAVGSILNNFWKMSNENKTTGSEITAF